MLVLLPFFAEIVPQSAEETSLSGLVFWFYRVGRDATTVDVVIVSVGVSG